jgi:hypothetical protein
MSATARRSSDGASQWMPITPPSQTDTYHKQTTMKSLSETPEPEETNWGVIFCIAFLIVFWTILFIQLL